MAQNQHAISIRETLTSITIAFALAFVFRAFVIEAFIIPTGSMAPTLLGAHMRFRADQSGYDWAVNPWRYQTQSGDFPLPIQDNILVNDPMTGQAIQEARVRRHAGDRILVLKYLIPFGIGPSRFDAVVFKNPSSPQQNFIKRLVGLPGEQVALVDGDVFVRSADAPTAPNVNLWAQDGWTIARKWHPDRGDLHGERIQRALWTPIYSSEYAPLSPTKDGRIFTPPWRPERSASGWDTEGRAYVYDGASPTALAWDTNIRAIVDRFPYNQTNDNGASVGWSVPRTPRPEFPVSDLRMRCGVEAQAEGLELAAVLSARGHEFRARFTADRVNIDMRPQGGQWQDLAEADMPPGAFRPGEITNIEFWHVDQTLHVLVGGERIASHAYGDDWSPAQRLAFATGRPFAELMAMREANPLADVANYITPYPQPRWEITAPTSAPVTLHRVGLDRDIFYQPGIRESGQPYWGTHPSTTRTLTDKQYFVCGDNSANSSDARAWEGVDPWVGVLDDTPGVVPEKLMIGKAFFVYFPSMVRGQVPVPAPDFGRMRWIW